MAGIDKAAIGFSIAIVVIGVAFAMYGDAAQNAGPSVSTPTVSETVKPVVEEKIKPLKDGYERVTSDTDPGLGHESHQLAVLLAPSDMTYSGTLLYDASENIQLVTLRGPIGADEKPAKTWTPDGETIFELTFVDPKNAIGEWAFSGNALAVHTMKTTPFQVDYKILDLTKTKAKVVELKEEVSMKESTPMEKPTMEKPAGPTTHTVDIPVGTSVPGCEASNECYLPADITINAGDTVEWINIDTAAHTVTGGSPADGPSGVFDSSLVMADATYAFTFNDAGSYDYFCMVHPWMVGTVTVN
ncbi:MAG: cupredoxin domain-containing protein [Candidatus Nitrosopumilus sp. bin_6a]